MPGSVLRLEDHLNTVATTTHTGPYIGLRDVELPETAMNETVRILQDETQREILTYRTQHGRLTWEFVPEDTTTSLAVVASGPGCSIGILS
jgi:hypothetical protein